MDSNGELDVRVAQLQQRVVGIEASIQSVANQVSNLASLINERARTPWGILIAGGGFAVSVILAVGGLAYAPIREAQTEMKADIRSVASNALSVNAFTDFKNTYESNRVAYRIDNEAKLKALSDNQNKDTQRLDETLKNIVPRGEHERVWANYDQRFVDQQRQIDELKAAQAATYGVRDVILDYRERLDRLERERLAARPAS